MTKEIEAPWKPKKDDQVTFNSPEDTDVNPGHHSMFHGHIRKVLPDDIVHIEGSTGRWFEAHLQKDNVKLVKQREL